MEWVKLAVLLLSSVLQSLLHIHHPQFAFAFSFTLFGVAGADIGTFSVDLGGSFFFREGSSLDLQTVATWGARSEQLGSPGKKDSDKIRKLEMVVLFFSFSSRITLFQLAWYCANSSNSPCISLIYFISTLSSFKVLAEKSTTIVWPLLPGNGCVITVDLVEIGSPGLTTSFVLFNSSHLVQLGNYGRNPEALGRFEHLVHLIINKIA